MMNINVFGKYKVTFTNKFDYISEYDYDRESYVYAKDKTTWKRKMQGGELMDMVAKLMLDHDAISIDSSENKIVVETFRPDNGTGGTLIIKYGAIENV